MKLIDARSGQVVQVNPLGRTVFNPPLVLSYGGGESTTINEVQMGLMSGKALASTNSAIGGVLGAGWAPLQIRFTHPGYPLERVAFIPS